MFIERQKYCWNTLRKGRLLAFQSDVQQAFTTFKNYNIEPEDITAQQFKQIAENSQFSLIIYCRAQEEDEQEYMQTLYSIIIENFFIFQNEAKQIFSIYALYFLYSQLERKRRINVDLDFLDAILTFTKKNSTKIDKHWMIIAKKLMQDCISIGIKTGLKTFLMKPNGQPARKNKNTFQSTSKKNDAKIQEQDQQKHQDQQYLQTFKKEISQLQMSLESYSKGKQKFNNQLGFSQNKLLFSDKNLGVRLIKKYNQYEKLLSQKHGQQKN